jgi:UDP-glucose 4-epimerase
MKGVSLVFHQAAIPSVARSVERPDVSFQVNAAGTLAVLMASREGSTNRLVYASSSSVYGGIESLPVTESLPTVPVSPYGVSKLAGELMCRSFTHTFGYPTVSLRYFNVFGPRQDPQSEYSAVIPRFIAAMLDGDRPTVFGDGHQTRDFTFVDNVVEANLLAAEAGDAALGQTFNVAQGRRTSLRDLLNKIGAVLGIADINPEWGPERSGDVRHSHADITAAGRVLGYVPRVDLEEGLRRTVEWLAAET